VKGAADLVAKVAAPASPPSGWLFHLFVLLHIICVVGGFGGMAYRAFVLDLARRRGDVATAGILGAYGQISSVAEVLIYGAAVFGVAAVAAGGHHSYFARPWLFAAVVIYVVMVGLLHGLVRPAERNYRRALLELAQAPSMPPPARPPQMAEMDRLQRRIGAGMGTFNVLLLGALYLMVFRP
jgi:hypothetical protein